MAIYFVTTVCNFRQDFFLNKENWVIEQLDDLKNKTPGIGLDYFVVMPNHIHIIFILTDCKLHLGEIVRRFKAKVSHTFGKNIWQANYYEHVIRNDKALTNIREYIINNPQELLLKFDQFYK